MENIKEIVKLLVLLFSPMFLLYLLNILIFNKYPVFLQCSLGSSLYFNCLCKINSCNKVIDNLLEKEKMELSNKDFINLLLVFIMTLLFTLLAQLVLKDDDIGYSFSITALIFIVMVHFKIPKRLFY